MNRISSDLQALHIESFFSIFIYVKYVRIYILHLNMKPFNFLRGNSFTNDWTCSFSMILDQPMLFHGGVGDKDCIIRKL